MSVSTNSGLVNLSATQLLDAAYTRLLIDSVIDLTHNVPVPFSPRLGATWAVSSDLRLRASYGEAFRAPNANEFYYEEVATDYAVVRNLDLQPEEITTYEVVLERQNGEHKH